MDDIQVVRIEEMYYEISSGQLPTRLSSNLGNGAGYMLYQFYAPLVYYIGALFHAVGFTLVQSTKLTFISGFILAAIGMFLLLRSRFSITATLFSTLLFLAAPYIGYDAFHRGSLGELYAICLLPFVFYCGLRIIQKPNYISFIYFSISITLLTIAHNLTAFMTFPFLVIFIFWMQGKTYITGFYAVLIGMLLSSFYWIPAIFEKKYIIIDQVDFITQTYKNHFLTLSQLAGIQPITWSFKPPTLGLNLLLVPMILMLVSVKQKKLLHDRLLLFSVCSFIFSLFMASNLSRPVWELGSSTLSFIQFPWRFLGLTTFFASICGAFLLDKFKTVVIKAIIGLIIILPLFTIYNSYLQPITYNYISKYTADDPCGTAGWSNEYIPTWVDECIPKGHKLEPVNIVRGNLSIHNLIAKDNSRYISFSTQGNGSIVFDKYFFPGWKLSIDGKTTPLKVSPPYGLMQTDIPEGKHNVELVFTNTPIRIFANTISAITALILVLLMFKRKQ